MIRRVQHDAELDDVVLLMRRSFGTVARELGLTEESAPTNPAFVTIEKLRILLERGAELFGMFEQGEVIGCVAIEAAGDGDGVYYLERLAVAPEKRHCGHGRALLEYAIDRIREAGGGVVSIALINDNRVLKQWYRGKGFAETGTRRFEHLPFEVCFMSRRLTVGRPPGGRRSSGSSREHCAETRGEEGMRE